MNSPKLMLIFLIVLIGLTLAAMISASGAAETAQDAAYADGGAQECMKCHDEPPVTLILGTPHAQKADARTPFASHQCETCHGASPEHLVKPAEGEARAPTKVSFGVRSKTPAAEQNEVCLGCHEGDARMNWTASQHESADSPCGSCHNIHSQKDKVLVKASQPEVCYSCHAEQRAQSFRRSRHPIREGKVTCSDCHNPHGSTGPKLLIKASVNETCFSCHAEKRGPFLWEHAPVSDDCTICHTPHGSSQPRLVKLRVPYLCQQCHQEAFHPSTLYSGSGVPPAGAARQILAKGCLNCHPKIHGSNHPSGVRFTR